MAKRVADRRKVRQALRHRISQKPVIRHVHFHIPHGLPQRSGSEQMLDQRQLEQHHQITVWLAAVLALQILHQIIYLCKAYHRVDFL